jgi:hypothetical protein
VTLDPDWFRKGALAHFTEVLSGVGCGKGDHGAAS